MIPANAMPDALVPAFLDVACIVPGERVLDLGSGDGRLLIAAARRGAVVTGLERMESRVTLSRDRLRAAGVGHRGRIDHVDYLTPSWREYDVILANQDYWLDLPAIRRKFLADCAHPGQRLVVWVAGGLDTPAVFEVLRVMS